MTARGGSNRIAHWTSGIILLIIISMPIFLYAKPQSNQLEQYRRAWQDSTVTRIMMTPDSPALYDSLKAIGSDEAIFELGRLCYSQGLYRQAEQYFLRLPRSKHRDIFLIQTEQILGNESSLDPQEISVDFSLLLLYNQQPDSIHAFNVTGYLANFLPPPKENKDIANSPDKYHIDGRFVLQFGAFSNKELAENLKQKLVENDVDARIEPSPDSSLYIVLAVGWDNREQAELLGERLNFIYTVIDREGKHE
mgnify:CR=1 FL=1